MGSNNILSWNQSKVYYRDQLKDNEIKADHIISDIDYDYDLRTVYKRTIITMAYLSFVLLNFCNAFCKPSLHKPWEIYHV